MQEKRIHRIFSVTSPCKGLHGLIEIIGGIALGLFSTDTILKLLYRWVGHEWFTRPSTSTSIIITSGSSSRHGAANLALAIGLLREKLWAYPASLVVRASSSSYQLPSLL